MENLDKFIAEGKHLEIINIDDKSINQHKCIAFIHLKKYSEALKYCGDSFEKAYIFYKLKKYKKAMKILNKIEVDEKRKDILMAQIFYKLKYYNKSIELLKKYLDDETYINIIAAENLLEASKKINISNISVTSKDKKVGESIKYNIKDKELIKEKEFNDTFKFINDEDKFVEELEKKSKNILILNQLKNVKGFFNNLDFQLLSAKEKKIVELNKEGNKNYKELDLLYEDFNSLVDKESIKIPENYKILRAYKFYNDKKFKSALKELKNDNSLVGRIIKYLCGEKEGLKDILTEIKDKQ